MNGAAEILVYIRNCAPFFGGDFNHSTATVIHDPSRKSFLAKLVGLVAVVGLAPRMLAKLPESTGTKGSPAPVSSFTLQRESRAVARRSESI